MTELLSPAARFPLIHPTVTLRASTVISTRPSSILQPTNRSVAVGTNVTLTALVNNPTPTLFQWRKNGSDIFGATGMSYTLNNVQMTDAGTYAVSAYNSAGSATSTNAVLNVGITPGITVQPVSVAVPSGGATNISVTATGAPLTYVWFKNGSVSARCHHLGPQLPQFREHQHWHLFRDCE